MQFKRLTTGQKLQKRWAQQRNHLVCRLLDADRFLTRDNALRQADKIMKAKLKPKNRKSR